MKRAILAVVTMMAVLLPVVPAMAHTEGDQHVIGKALEPRPGGYFFGMAKTICDGGGGIYGVACVTSRRVVKITVQRRTWIEGSGWSRWGNITWEREFYCEQSASNHCTDAETVAYIQHDCDCPGDQWRTRVKAGYKKYDGVWIFTGYYHSDPVYNGECN